MTTRHPLAGREVLEHGWPGPSRSRARWCVIGLGVVLLVAAACSRLIVYPQQAKLPLTALTWHSRAESATVAGPLSTAREHTTWLGRTERIHPDLTASDRGPGGAVFRDSVRTTTGAGLTANRSATSYVVDRKSASARGRGLVFAFPADATRDNYRWWDQTLGRAVPIRFAADRQVRGLDAAVYVRESPPTVVGTEQVPARLVGAGGPDRLLPADRVYSVRERIWVNPASGVVLQDRRRVRSELRFRGESILTLREATFRFDRETVDRAVARARPRAEQLTLTGRWFPWVSGGLGLLLLGVGATMRAVSLSRNS